MSTPDMDGLTGRSAQTGDIVDAHRWDGYHRYFERTAKDSPLALHWLMFAGIPEATREDGHAMVMAPFPPLPYPRRMWAGGEIRWLRPIAKDQSLTRTTTVVKAEPKQGAAGDFLLTALSHRITGGDEVMIEERQDIVFLPASTRPGTAPPRPPSFTPDWSEARAFGNVDLFRYSALTSNSHRIHYDEAFARDVEHYPGLVVHGPLLASHLIHAGARAADGKSPVSFTYRAVAPLFAGEEARVIGCRDTSGNLQLAVTGPDGGLRTTAAMTFRQEPT